MTVISLLLLALIVLTCGYTAYEWDKESIERERKEAQERAASAAACYARQMARLKAHNMRAKYRRAT